MGAASEFGDMTEIRCLRRIFGSCPRNSVGETELKLYALPGTESTE